MDSGSKRNHRADGGIRRAGRGTVEATARTPAGCDLDQHMAVLVHRWRGVETGQPLVRDAARNDVCSRQPCREAERRWRNTDGGEWAEAAGFFRAADPGGE